MHHQFIPGSAAYDDEVARRVAAYTGLGGKYDLFDADNIQEAICESGPVFWQELARRMSSQENITVYVYGRVRTYYTRIAKEKVEEELDDERQRAQNPELVNRDE